MEQPLWQINPKSRQSQSFLNLRNVPRQGEMKSVVTLHSLQAQQHHHRKRLQNQQHPPRKQLTEKNNRKRHGEKESYQKA